MYGWLLDYLETDEERILLGRWAVSLAAPRIAARRVSYWVIIRDQLPRERNGATRAMKKTAAATTLHMRMPLVPRCSSSRDRSSGIAQIPFAKG